MTEEFHRELLLLSHKISWKHLQEPADSARLEEFNNAVRRSDHTASAAAHGGGQRKRKAGISIQVSATPEKAGQVVSGGVPAARSANVVDADDRKAEDIGGAFGHTFRSDHMASADGVGGGLEKNATSVVILVGRKACDAVKRRERARPERTDDRAGEDGGSVRTLNGTIRSAFKSSATAPPPDDIFGEGNRTDLSAVGSSKVCAGDEETDPSSSRDPFGKPIPLSRTKPVEAVTPSSAAADDSDGGVSLYELGLAAALAMDDEALNSAVARHVGLEPHQEQRPQRRAVRQRKAAAASTKAAAVYFSLRLSDEEAMEDVAAVSLVKDDVNSEAKAPVVYRNEKRRRRR